MMIIIFIIKEYIFSQILTFKSGHGIFVPNLKLGPCSVYEDFLSLQPLEMSSSSHFSLINKLFIDVSLIPFLQKTRGNTFRGQLKKQVYEHKKFGTK